METEYTLEKKHETPETMKADIVELYSQIGELECRKHQLIASVFELTERYNQLIGSK